MAYARGSLSVSARFTVLEQADRSSRVGTVDNHVLVCWDFQSIARSTWQQSLVAGVRAVTREAYWLSVTVTHRGFYTLNCFVNVLCLQVFMRNLPMHVSLVLPIYIESKLWMAKIKKKKKVGLC